MITTAVIIAAGLGSRFGKMTENMPKGFIEVGGISMIVRSINTLISCGIKRIVIGTGYKKEAYETLKINGVRIECVYSPLYAQTNSMFTLKNCEEVIGDDDFILLESDIIYSKDAITELQNKEYPDIMLITPVTKFQDQYYVEYDESGILTRCSTNRNEIDVRGELVGIHKLSSTFYHKMCEEYAKIVEDNPQLGYEYQLLWMSQHIRPVYVLNSANVKWYEIDDEEDLKYAEKNIIPLI